MNNLCGTLSQIFLQDVQQLVNGKNWKEYYLMNFSPDRPITAASIPDSIRSKCTSYVEISTKDMESIKTGITNTLYLHID